MKKLTLLFILSLNLSFLYAKEITFSVGAGQQKKSYAQSQCSASSIPRQTSAWQPAENSFQKTGKRLLNQAAARQSQKTCSPQAEVLSKVT